MNFCTSILYDRVDCDQVWIAYSMKICKVRTKHSFFQAGWNKILYFSSSLVVRVYTKIEYENAKSWKSGYFVRFLQQAFTKGFVLHRELHRVFVVCLISGGIDGFYSIKQLFNSSFTNGHKAVSNFRYYYFKCTVCLLFSDPYYISLVFFYISVLSTILLDDQYQRRVAVLFLRDCMLWWKGCK